MAKTHRRTWMMTEEELKKIEKRNEKDWCYCHDCDSSESVSVLIAEVRKYEKEIQRLKDVECRLWSDIGSHEQEIKQLKNDAKEADSVMNAAAEHLWNRLTR